MDLTEILITLILILIAITIFIVIITRSQFGTNGSSIEFESIQPLRSRTSSYIS